MKKMVLPLLLAALVVGSHGAFFEVYNEGIPLVLSGGTGGIALEYHLDAGEWVFLRPGISFGSEGVKPAGTLGYGFPYSRYDLRIGVFNDKPYVAVGIGL